MPTSMRLASPSPTPSVRTDYSSHTFKIHTQDHEDELFAYAMDLSEKILPTRSRLEPSKGQYFDVKYLHACGISLEFTPIESPKSTAGCALLNLPGAAWGSLDASERRDLIIDVGSWPGLYRTTRWDPQITVIDPPITVDKIIDDVAAGRMWPARFATQQAWERRDKDGLLIEPPTQYFGSPQSNVRLRIYDHGAKHDWAVPSLRVEAQLRKEVADQHFKRLYKRCTEEADVDPLLVSQESRTVKDALKQHAPFKDTSKWEGRPKPRRWAQSASEPAWWEEMLQHEAEPLTLTHRAELDWDKTIVALKEQYGRKLWLFVWGEWLKSDSDPDDVLFRLLVECGGKLKKDDAELLASVAPAGKKRLARELVRRSAHLAATIEECGADLRSQLPR